MRRAEIAQPDSMKLTDVASRPSIATECTGCTNSKSAGAIGVDSPQIMRCQCDNKLGLGKDRWPVSVFDLSMSIPFHDIVMRLETLI